jgi:1-deoxy-D-xylulose-5-phosphate reductoisomerase
MRVPIQYALTYPERHPSSAGRLDLAAIGKLNFREMDMERYPCLALAYACGRLGGTAPTVYNAANEVAVARFLKGEISFLDIERVLENTVARHSVAPVTGLDVIQEADSWARSAAANA